jgi:hypothetical protein
MSRARAIARHGALDLLAAGCIVGGKLEHRLTLPRVHFAYMHDVPAPHLADFRALLRALCEHFVFVTYSEGVRIATGAQPIDKPFLCLSFDDGFKSNVAAAEVVEEFGGNACFFVPTDFVGCNSVDGAKRFFGTSRGVTEGAMGWQDLERLCDRGHEVGSHTVTHRVMASLSRQEIADELGRSQDILVSRLGQGQHFAWPLGRFHHFSVEAARCVFATGYASCASAERGAHLPGMDSQGCIRRDHLVAGWPRRHSLYLLSRSATRAGSGWWPNEWLVG